MNGFLDTNGVLHQCNAWEHLLKAVKLTEELGVNFYSGIDAEEYLQKLGWVVVRSNDVYALIGIRINGKRLHLTDAQKEYLIKIYGEVNENCQRSIDELLENDD